MTPSGGKRIKYIVFSSGGQSGAGYGIWCSIYENFDILVSLLQSLGRVGGMMMIQEDFSRGKN